MADAAKGFGEALVISTTSFRTTDGIDIAVHETGSGRPVILLHGYFSDADTNWIKYGHAKALADAGYRVIMPDLRAHGQSGKPHDPANYPLDILADDQFALIEHLGLGEFDLGGYSLGGRTVARMLARGCRPGHVLIAGMGLQGLTDTGKRSSHFRHVLDNLGKHERGSPAFMAEAFLKTSGGDPIALRLILDTFVDTQRNVIEAFDFPVGVICGIDDRDNSSAEELAEVLPQGTMYEIPGNHMSAVVKPELAQAMIDVLS